MDGFINLNKGDGLSSFKAIAKLRRITGEKKVGHTGTLDPMATGVLPATIGQASKFIGLLPTYPKGYDAKFRLGLTTDTLDITGEVTGRYDVLVSESDVKAVLEKFVGKIKQIPPMYSALSKDGVKLYDLARKGIEVEREARDVEIYEISYNGCEDGEYSISVSCSQGTYIRTLIDDLGRELGCGAVMTALVRTASNGFNIENSYTIDEMEKLADDGRFEEFIIPVRKIMSVYPSVFITEKQAVRFTNGAGLDVGRIKDIPEKSGLLSVYSGEDFLGVGEICDGELICRRVYLR